MNYATLIALLAAMSFSLPLLLKLEEYFGIQRNDGIVFSLAIVVFGWVWLYLRWRTKTKNLVEYHILPDEPYLPEIFYESDEFQGEIFFRERNYQKALKIYELYKLVLDRQGTDTEELTKTIAEIKQIISADKNDK